MSDIAFDKHATITGFDVHNDEIVVGGQTLSRLAAAVGKTPFYVYDRSLLTARVNTLRRAMPDRLRLHYAMKANPMPAVVQHMAGLVDGLDVASADEMQVALDTGIAREHISFAGPGKGPTDLRRAVAAGIIVNLESEQEMERIADAGQALGLQPSVAVRVNPDFQLKSSGMKMGGGPQQFGVDAERVPAMLSRLGQLALNFVGFHIYSGSQNLKAESIMETQAQTFMLAARLAQHAPGPVRLLNIGGGLGIPYFPGEHPLDLDPLGANLETLLDRCAAEMPDTAVAMELGRYLVGEAGLYVCRVIDRKESRGQIFLVTDGGLHHHLAASGNFGQIIRKNYPVTIGTRVRGDEREIASVVGPLCTPLDLLADRMDLARAEVGDLIAVFQSGAYGLTASPTAFLSHAKPAEILV